MKYMVMETHPAYAVVLDEDGRFLKAANLRYQVGDTVQDIVELRTPQKKVVPAWKPLSGLAAAAACLCLVFFGWYQPNYTAYGTLRIQINPDVEMTVSRTDRVLDLEGLNADGEDLIEEYDYQGKDRETAANELVERAIDMGYLSDGETVSITVSSTDADWQAREETQVRAQLEAPSGVMVSPWRATVQVDIVRNYERRIFQDMPLLLLSEPGGNRRFQVEVLDKPRVDVTVSGLAQPVSALRTGDVKVYLDISRLSEPGIYTLPVGCYVKGDSLDVREIYPEQIKVKITNLR